MHSNFLDSVLDSSLGRYVNLGDLSCVCLRFVLRLNEELTQLLAHGKQLLLNKCFRTFVVEGTKNGYSPRYILKKKKGLFI